MNPAKLLTLDKNQEITLTIASLAHGGSGVGRFENFVVFVPFTVPEDVVKVRILTLKKNYADGELIEVLTPSRFRIKAPCEVFGICGGCQWQNVAYEEQLKQKQNIVEHALSRIAREENVEILPIMRSPQEFHYRNRAQFRSEGQQVGFYQRATHKIIEFPKCHIIDERLNTELSNIKKECTQAHPDKTAKTEVFLTEAGKVIRSTNKANGEELGFSQVNTAQNLKMLEYVAQILGTPSKVDEDNAGSKGNLLDLYCGNGNFSHFLNKKGWRIYGIDTNRQAITVARKNANTQTFFSAGDCSQGAKKLAELDRSFETILLDPPRIGADERLWPWIAKLKPQKLVYVSCNPTTFARDWARIKNKTGMKLVSVQPIDMFPQTFHVELVALAITPESN